MSSASTQARCHRDSWVTVTLPDGSPARVEHYWHIDIGGKSDVLEPFQRWFWPIAGHFGNVKGARRLRRQSAHVVLSALVMERHSPVPLMN